MRILGLIPARGGSKGVPHKNKKELHGKPLLQYTIDAAKEAVGIDRLVFSSEDESLRSLAKEMGAEVPFERPDHLAQDASGSLGVVQHALQSLAQQGDQYDAVCLLQVTNPFRTTAFIDKAINAFKVSDTDALVSVLKVPHEYNPHWVFEANDAGQLYLATGEKDIIKRRQDLPDAFIRDGGIYITKTKVILEDDSLYGSSLSHIVSDPARHVNIDTMDDWYTAETMAKILFP
jgi:CMP-N-acetylneuraminic acid synthetase